MADKNRISMPSSTAGITRYSEDYVSRLTLKPVNVIILAIIIILITILLHTFGGNIIG